MLWVFETPVVQVKCPQYRDGRPTALVMYATLGVSVLRVDGVWREVQTPSSALVKTADRVYRGGYANVIDDDAKAELVAAGYGDRITRLPDQFVDVAEDVLQ